MCYLIEKSFWPDVTMNKDVRCVFDLFDSLKRSLKNKYDGLIDCLLEKTKYKFTDFTKYMGMSVNLTAELMQNEPGIAKGREKVKLDEPEIYMFVIFTKKYFFRIFDLKIAKYFPVFIRPADGITDVGYSDFKRIESENELETEVANCLNSNYVHEIIKFMISNSKM